jgi:hypothetical protein
MMTPKPSKPSLWYLALAGLVLVAGIGVLAWAIVHFVTGIAHGPIPVDGPGTSEITLNKAGRYTIFQDYPSSQSPPFDGSPGKLYPICSVTSADGQRKIPVRPPRIANTYKLQDRTCQAMYEFEIDQPGKYRISSRNAGGTDNPTYALGVGPSFQSIGIFFSMCFGFAACFGSVVIAAAILIVVLVKRSKASQIATASLMAPFPPPETPPTAPGSSPLNPTR